MTEQNIPNYMTDNRLNLVNGISMTPTGDNTYTVSEEDAARLKAMAMTNQASGPEAIAQMLGANGKEIPKDIYNYICMEEAKSEIKKYHSDAASATDGIIDDNATKEILDEAEATTKLSQFDFGNIDEYLKKLDTLSFLEAVSYKKKVEEEIARWKSCQSMLHAISNLKLDDTVNRELMKINAMEEYDFQDSFEDFESHYDENLGKLSSILGKLTYIITSHKHEMDSTEFLTNEMVHLLEGKLAKLDQNDLNYGYNKAKMENVLEAFKNRLNLDYLKGKLEIYLRTNKSKIKKDFKDNSRLISNNCRTKVINDLIRFFNEDIVHAVFEQFVYAFYDDVYVIYLMFGFLAKVMNTEKKSSKDAWVKVLMLNLSDMHNGIFDIDTLSDDNGSYLQQVRDAFYPMLVAFVRNNHLYGSIYNSTTFGLRRVAKLADEPTAMAVEAGSEVETFTRSTV